MWTNEEGNVTNIKKIMHIFSSYWKSLTIALFNYRLLWTSTNIPVVSKSLTRFTEIGVSHLKGFQEREKKVKIVWRNLRPLTTIWYQELFIHQWLRKFVPNPKIIWLVLSKVIVRVWNNNEMLERTYKVNCLSVSFLAKKLPINGKESMWWCLRGCMYVRVHVVHVALVSGEAARKLRRWAAEQTSAAVAHPKKATFL